MIFFTTPNSKNIIPTLRIVKIEKSELTFLLILYFHVSRHLDHIAKGIDTYSKKYVKVLLMGDFNIKLKEANMKTFCNQYKLKALNEEPTCFKNYTNPSCIDLYLTNCPKSFQSTLTIETGLSDFHKLIVTVLKVKHEKVPPKIIHYRDYKNFDSNKFFEKLQLKLSNLDMNSLDFLSLKLCLWNF